MEKLDANTKMHKQEINEKAAMEKERLLNMMTQQELLKTTKDMNETLKELTKTLKVLEKHEYLELHRSKWKLVGYNILLGILFAFGTVFWLVILSWVTLHVFKDSILLKQIVENQLNIRQMNVGEMQEKIKNSLKKPETTETMTGEITKSGTLK